MTYPVCRHWRVEWLDDCRAECCDCGKVGLWRDGTVVWQRRPAAWYRLPAGHYAACQQRDRLPHRQAAG